MTQAQRIKQRENDIWFDYVKLMVVWVWGSDIADDVLIRIANRLNDLYINDQADYTLQQIADGYHDAMEAFRGKEPTTTHIYLYINS